MKKIIYFILPALLFAACVSGPSSSSADPDDIIERWAAALEGKDLDTLMTTYWPDAIVVLPGEDGSEDVWNGSDEIRELQSGSTGNPDLKLGIRLDTSRRVMEGNTVIYAIDVEAGEAVIVNTLKLEKRDNEWRIVYQALEFKQ